MKVLWFISGFVSGVMGLTLALASVPKSGKVTDDTVIYQNLSEIKVAREGELNFDGDVARLHASEGHYKESLPPAKLRGPMKRISQRKYRPSSSSKPVNP